MSFIKSLNSACFFSEHLSSIRGIKHFFSTSINGSFASVLEDLETRNKSSEIMNIMKTNNMSNEEIFYLKQVHSDKIVIVEGSNPIGEPVPEGDAIITSKCSLAIGVFTADCVPLLVYDKSKRIIAAIHAGWKGTKLGIASKTIGCMIDKFGSKPESIIVAIGPCIGSCCFEVSEDLYDKFNNKKFENNKFYVDLGLENQSQLLDIGIDPNNIEISNLCTMHNPKLFHSYRREHEHSGRQTSFIQLNNY
jgi:YfiH family protein